MNVEADHIIRTVYFVITRWCMVPGNFDQLIVEEWNLCLPHLVPCDTVQAIQHPIVGCRNKYFL